MKKGRIDREKVGLEALYRLLLGLGLDNNYYQECQSIIVNEYCFL